MRKTADKRRRIERLELIERAAVNDAGDDLAHIVGLTRIGWNEAVNFMGVIKRLGRLSDHDGGTFFSIKCADDLARTRKRMLVARGIMIRDARDSGMDFGAAKLLCRNHFACRRLNKGR